MESIVFVVLFCRGENEGFTTSVVRTFTDRETAGNFVDRKNAEIQRVIDLVDASSALLAVWDNEHPAPPTCYDEGWNKDKEEEYYHARMKEEERIYQVLGIYAEWEKLKLTAYDGCSAYYRVISSKLDGDWYEDV